MSVRGFGDSPSHQTRSALPLSIFSPRKSLHLKTVATVGTYPIMCSFSLSSATKTKEAAQAKFPKACTFTLYVAYGLQIVAAAFWAMNARSRRWSLIRRRHLHLRGLDVGLKFLRINATLRALAPAILMTTIRTEHKEIPFLLIIDK